VLTSGKVDAGTFPSVPLLQYGGITVGTACEAFAGEADVSISVSSGTISFAGHSSITGDFGAANFPNSAGAVLGRATTAGATTFTALTSAGKTLNGEVLMLHNGSGSCSYEASGLTGG
jgi:hypothetical protein